MTEHIAALLASGRIYEMVNVRPGASSEEIKKACKSARLRNHPDKGGDAEVFKLVEAAIELLLNELPNFDGPPPPWTMSLCTQIEICRNSLAKFEIQCSEFATTGKTTRAKHTADNRLLQAVSELQRLRKLYKELHSQHMQEQADKAARAQREQEEEAARVERMMKIARQRKIQIRREKDALRKRCSRKTSTSFPPLPKGYADTCFRKLHIRFRRLSQSKSRYMKEGKDVTSIDDEMGELLLQARSMADKIVAAGCESRCVHDRFPRLACTDPRYEHLESLRHANRKLCDRMRKLRKRTDQDESKLDDLEEQAEEIVRQAWKLCKSMAEHSSETQISGTMT